ncbi:nuclear transport factor 2 family protein [Solirubrobacter soli]|uniref:nuclear transport factor 2 family protein n=1 Tax=Solirubrobacter soli TaxID=363832 RepID=UPI00069E6154|nr:nuclear transport factor 2 family protein [Solirubrobacter soli]
MTLAALYDRNEITDVLAGLGRWLDDKRWDHADEVLTADVRATTPGGTAEGREAVVAQARRNHDEVTQHLFSNVVVDLDGDRADVSAESLIALGPERRVGSRYALAFVRTAAGWRIDALTVTPVWSTPA